MLRSAGYCDVQHSHGQGAIAAHQPVQQSRRSETIRLQHEIQIEGQVSDDDFSDLEHEAALLAAKVAAKKAALRFKAQG